MGAVSVREARLEDLDAIVQVHFDAFRDYFITHLGRRVMKAYYRAYLENPRAVNVVGCVDGQVVGFACGRSCADCDVLGDFYRKNILKVVCAVIGGVLRGDKVLVAGLRIRLGQIKVACRSLFDTSKINNGRKTKEMTGAMALPEGGLVSIAVRGDFQGKNLATRVIGEFEMAAAQKGADVLRLSVHKDNGRAIAFYKKSGWYIDGEDGIEYIMRKQMRISRGRDVGVSK